MLDSAFLMLGQTDIVINWFTPVWIVALGISLGFLVAMLFVGLVYLISMTPGLNQIGVKSKSFWIAGGVTTILLLAAAIGIPVWQRGISLSEYVNQQPVEMIFLASFVALVGFAIWVLGARARIDEMRELLSEGLLRYLSFFCLGMLGFTAIGLLLNIFANVGLFQIVEDPKGLLNSLARIPTASWQERSYEVPPSAPGTTGEELPILINGRESRDLVVKSNQQIDIAFRPITADLPSDAIFQVQSTSAESGTRFSMAGKIADEVVKSVYIFNRGANPAQVTVSWLVMPVYREMYAVPLIAAGVAIFFIAFMCLSALSPKVSAIALATFKTEIGQPLFILALAIGLGFILLSIYFPYNTFGEDIKMYKDSGMTLIRVLAIFAAIWAASKSVAEEIEGRTALTVLSKPVGRRQFILGKFFGISAAMTWLFVLLGFWFLFWVAYKPLYDAKESTLPDIDWTNCFAAVTSIMPVMLLAFLEVVVFVAISVAISTRFGILANLMICFAIYILGHLTPQLVQSNQMVEAFAPVVFFGQLIAIIFPVLDHFDAQTAINTDKAVPLLYLGWSFIYTLLYGSLALLLALVLFEDRDLA